MLAYVGDHPFIFFSYCHINKSQITQIADTLDKDGYRIWYDKSLEAGSAFDDVTAEHISASSVFVLFLSNNYLDSKYCNMELKYAMEKGCTCIAVHLEHVDFRKNPEMQRALQNVHQIPKYRMTEEQFFPQLYSVPAFQTCRYAADEPHSEVILREIPMQRKPAWYGIMGTLLGLSGIFSVMQVIWQTGPLHITLLLLQVLLFCCGWFVLRWEEKHFRHLAARNSPTAVLAMFLTCINYDMTVPQLAHGAPAVQISVSILVCIFHLMLISPFLDPFFRKKSLPNADYCFLTCHVVRMASIFLMMQMFRTEYRWAACLQAFLTGWFSILPTYYARKQQRLSHMLVGAAALLSAFCIAISALLIFLPDLKLFAMTASSVFWKG